MIHYWWVPLVILFYVISSYLSVYAKEGWKYVILLYLLQCLGLWPLVAKYSKNLAADGLLFDVLILTSFYCTIWYMGQMQDFSITQWLGFGLALVGIFLMKGIV